MKAALDYLLFSDEQIQLIKAHKLKGNDLKVLEYLLLNYNTSNDKVHQRRPSQIAKDLGIHPSYVRLALKKINKAGLGELFIKNKKVAGILKRTAVETLITADLKPEDANQLVQMDFMHEKTELQAAMAAKQAIQLLIDNSVSTITHLVALTLPRYCSLQSGTMNPIRTCEIAEMLGCDRTSVDRAIDTLNRIGYCQIERDYVLVGRLPYTAYAYNQNHLKKKAKAAAKANKGKAKAIAMSLVEAVDLLQNAYGIVEQRFLRTHSEVKRLAELLTKKWGIQSLIYDGESHTKGIGEVDLPFSDAPGTL